MALPTPKELKELAKACREAGIRTFKCGEVEFTLTEDAPVTKPRGIAAQKAKAAKVNHDDGKPPETEDAAPTEDELLLWSAMGGMPILPADRGSS